MPINLRNSDHPGLHYADLMKNSFAAMHEPIGGIAVWNGQLENGPDEAPEGWELKPSSFGGTGTIVRMAGGLSGNYCLMGGQAAAGTGGMATSLKYIPVDLSKTYILEFSVKADAVDANHSFRCYMECYDAAKTLITSYQRVVDRWINIPTTWTRIVRGIGASAPLKFAATTAYVRFSFYLSTANVAGCYVYLDDVQLRILPREQELVNSGSVWAALYGTWGNAVSHPLSEWFTSLASAQVVYPHAIATTDELDWAAIQGAVNDVTAVRGNVYLEAGDFQEARPLVIPATGEVHLIGRGIRLTIIRKTTATVGPATVRTYGAVNDSMAVDAIVIMDHPDDVGNYYSEIRDLSLVRTDAAQGGYGLWAPRIAYFTMRRVTITDISIGIQIFQSWLTEWDQVFITGISDDSGYGFYVPNDGSGNGGGTSYVLTNCYLKHFANGYFFYGCAYSSLRSCAADFIGSAQAVGTAYEVYLCGGFDLLACGCEVVTGRTLHFGASNRMVNVTGFRAINITGFSATYGTVHIEGGKVSFSNCLWDALLAANGQYNEMYVLGTSAPVVTWENCVRPSGGVQNYHIKNDDIITTHGLRGWKVALVSGTAFQLLHVWCFGGVNASTYMGSLTGILTLGISGRTTTNSRDQMARTYLVTIWAWANTALTASIQQLGVDNTEGIAFTAVAVAGRAGATLTDLYLDCTATWANNDNTYNVAYWDFRPQSGAIHNKCQMEAGLA